MRAVAMVVGLLLWGCTAALCARASAAEEAARHPPSSLDAAWDDFRQALEESTRFVREHPFYQDEENRAAAYAFLSSMTLARIEEDIVFDAVQPYFRVLDHRIREGGDNPDQRYLIATLRGGESYRVWGTRGTSRRLEFQLYAGDPYVAGGGGRSASSLRSEDLAVAADGSFELLLSPGRRPGNWLENPPDGSSLLVRQIFSDWENETPGEVHIDRLGHEGEQKAVLDESGMAARLRKAAADLRLHVKVWPEMVQRRYLSRPANVLSEPADPGAAGGVPGRLMASGHFELAPDEALVVRTWPAGGDYQGIQLADLWFSSLEYANRQTSLTADQAQPSKDGSFYFVVAGRDPGVPNWLDTTGRRRGVILLRFDGMQGRSIPREHYPRAERVKLAELRRHLPADTPVLTPEEREREIAARRRHVQRRFGS